jgi:hypothetical protein
LLTINEDSIQLVQLDVVTWDMYTDALHSYLAITLISFTNDTVVIRSTQQLRIELKIAILTILYQRLLKASHSRNGASTITPSFEGIIDFKLGENAE